MNVDVNVDVLRGHRELSPNIAIRSSSEGSSPYSMVTLINLWSSITSRRSTGLGFLEVIILFRDKNEGGELINQSSF